MLRQILCTIYFVVLITTQVFAQQKWVSFSGKGKEKSAVNLLSSNNSGVSFTVQVNGMEKTEKRVEYTTYNSLSIPDAVKISEEGLPQLPFITKVIAIPDCDDVSISVTPSNKIKLKGYNVLPAPRFEKKESADGSYIYEEVYDEDFSVYTKDVSFPGKFGEIIETGYVRGQKIARVAVYPVQFNSAKKELEVYTDFNISLSFVNPTSEVNKELGIFRNMMNHTALNYSLNGISASTKDVNKALGKNLSKVTSGSVTRVTDLSQLVGASALPVDYLIITHSTLFNSSSLTTLAEHRRDYNGFDVAIVKVDDDVYNFKPRAEQYISIRDFIKDVYQNGTANHTGDGSLGYICLVGDANFNNTTVMLPSSNAYNEFFGFDKASDYYYACTDGDTDNLLDLMYGRLSVGNVTELSNIVNKIKYYENSSSGSWKNNVSFMSFSPEYFKYTSDPAFTSMAGVVPSSNYISYSWRGYAADTAQAWGRYSFNHHSVNDVSTAGSLVDEMWYSRYTAWSWCEWEGIMCVFKYDGEYTNPNNYCGSTQINAWLYNKLNSGQHTFVYEGHGGAGCLGAGEGEGRRIFKVNEIASNLNNFGKYPFIIAAACETGKLDATTPDDMGSVDCIGEAVVNLPNAGAIGYLGSSRDSYSDSFGIVDKYILEAQHKSLSLVMGEAVMESKINLDNSGRQLLFRRQYNLYGDPALNLWPSGYTVSDNITLSGTVDITSDLTVAAGKTLTVSSGAVVRFSPGKKIMVNGTLNASSATFTSQATSETWEGIKFQSGSSGNINGCTINNVNSTTGAVYITGSAPTFTNSTINNLTSTTDGVQIVNSSNVFFNNNNIQGGDDGIYVYHSTAYFIENDISAADKVFDADYYSQVHFHEVINYGSYGNNNIHGANYGIKANYSTSFCAGMREEEGGGEHNVFSNNLFNVYITNNSGIEARRNYWTPNPPTKTYTGSGCYFYYDGYLSKANGGTEYLNYLLSVKKFRHKKETTKTFEQLAIILNGFESAEGIGIVYSELAQLYYDSSDKTVLNFLEAKKSNKNNTNRAELLEVLAGLYATDNKEEKLNEVINELITDYNNTDHEKNGLMTKFFWNYKKGDYKEATKALSLISEKYKNDKEVKIALALIGAENKITFKKEAENSISDLIPEEFQLIGNYPNPFNPTTIINYSVPLNSNVKISIYDIMGREIKTFEMSSQSSGYHNVEWNGTNESGLKVSSGTYIYRMEAVSLEGKTESFVQSKKMILLK
ncbi:MAG: T9SS type A sorting domain-containing protein [Bacteroidetes bacterium]|nr:T9SS type A sorting domain-containing protein [Bacteroidota bacterium]